MSKCERKKNSKERDTDLAQGYPQILKGAWQGINSNTFHDLQELITRRKIEINRSIEIEENKKKEAGDEAKRGQAS